MRKRFFFIVVISIAVCALCSNLTSCKKVKHDYMHFYSVDFNHYGDSGEQEIDITMHYPTVGLVRVGQISWGNDGNDPDDVEKDIYDNLHPKVYRLDKERLTGTWHLYLTLKEQDKYGNWIDGAVRVPIGILNAEDVQKYTDYKYFRGTVTKMIYDGYMKSQSIQTTPNYYNPADSF